MTRSTIQTRVAALAACCLVLAACGGDDDEPVADTASPVTDGDAQPTASGDGPDATIDPDLPAEYVDVVGPVEVIGESLPTLPADGTDDAVGSAAPVLVGVDYDGSTVRIDPGADGPTMIVFLAHWCSHCNAEVPRLNQLRDEGRFPEGLDIVAVSTAVNPGQPNFPPDEWLVEMDWTYPAMADGVDVSRETFIAADAFGVSGFPFVTLVDEDGTVAARWSGEREPDEIISMIESNLDV